MEIIDEKTAFSYSFAIVPDDGVSDQAWYFP